jgi:hypothetical protein
MQKGILITKDEVVVEKRVYGGGVDDITTELNAEGVQYQILDDTDPLFINALPAKPYLEERRAAYPPLTDLADALVHQHMGDEAPLLAYFEKCEAVKTQFPKT